MAGLEPLIPHIYHEKQQPGSMLCAQHALNSLLQGSYFTAPDLSDIGRNLDALEQEHRYDETNTGRSTNLDDTGFFSVQVLDNALHVWGLNLVRWRSESMRPYQDQPHTQLAFILNLEQHWFTLRRFGDANGDIDRDQGNGHWFNLNSFLPEPEWVGKLYLGMVLQQAEAEGYSVFAVTQIDPSGPLALPRTEADIIASTIPEPTSASSTQSRPAFRRTLSPPKKTIPLPEENATDLGFEDEDYELQAALQASLMAHQAQEQPPRPLASESDDNDEPLSPLFTNPSLPGNPHASSLPDPSISPLPNQQFGPGHADIDPVTASMERNRVLLERMREQQEFAHREMWSEADLSPEELEALQERRRRRQEEEDAEAEELKRAIAESEEMARMDQLRREQREFGAPDQPELQGARIDVDDLDDKELAQILEMDAREQRERETRQRKADVDMDVDDDESFVSESGGDVDVNDVPPVPAAAPTLDEIRKARLARFAS